jgi:hypothetical protein
MRRWSVKPISSPPRPPRRAARPGRRYAATCWPGCSPAGGADQAGNSLVRPEARLPVPPWPHQRHRPGTRLGEEHPRPRRSDPAAPGRPGHPRR